MAEATPDINLDRVAAEAVRLLGGPVSAARKLGVDNYQSVQGWARNSIPARYCLRVEALTGISRKVLRPDDWADYWPEPAEAKAA